MLFTRNFSEGIRAGRITRTYRIWKRPQAKPGGRYNLAPDGIIEVDTVDSVRLKDVTDPDAKLAGFDTQKDLVEFLERDDAELYQVDFRYLGSGAVRVPERGRIESGEVEALATRLRKMDERSEQPWTAEALRLIGDNPGRRAGDLAPNLNWETKKFKAQIRKLKALGLTISLDTGYRLSPRGAQALKALDS